MKFIYLALVIISTSLIYLAYLLTTFIPKHDLMNTCLEYERVGSIQVGSCACAKELFPDFSKSYDWMDACDILESRKNI